MKKENEVAYDCPHCGNLIFVKVSLRKGEKTILTKPKKSE